MERYDVAIIGSGYGGSVVAARLAPTREVLVLERGRRWATEDFPEDLAGLIRGYRKAGAAGERGLWEMRLGRGVGNAAVSAVGGASVVNYGISMQPDDHVFEDWPVSAAQMSPYYERARMALRPEPNPRADELGDKRFIDLVEPGRRHDIVNTIDWSRCTDCGNCILGCRHGAKRSLDRTYLRQAEEAGAQVWPETTVVDFSPEREGFRIAVRPTGQPEVAPRVLHARRLIVSAGTFGTLDLMMRHRNRFPLSARFGERMSMNGDALAFLYNTAHEQHGFSGAPISTSARTHLVDPSGGRRTLTIMSGRIPKAMMGWSSLAMGLLAEGVGRNRGPLDQGWTRARRRIRDLVGPKAGGAFSHTFLYKLDGQDAAAGRLGLDDRGRAVIDWEGYSRDPILRFAAGKLEDWAEKVGGRVIRDLGTWPGMRSFGVHPLGGCGMGASVASGVTDSFGRVFAPGGGFHPGLRIVDASIIPGSLGVPPSLTVAAVAERAAEQLLSE